MAFWKETDITKRGPGWVHFGDECGPTWGVTAGEVEVEWGCGSNCGGTAPRDVVLRLLAAEASDRLGWVWEVAVDEFNGRLSAHREDWPAHWCVWSDGTIVAENHIGLPDTPDELLASLHGRFLLLDALKEANDVSP